jgi:hypothetical protein
MEGGQITVESLSKYLGAKLAIFRRGLENPKFNAILTGPNIPLYAGREGRREELSGAGREEGDSWRGACNSVLRSIIVFPDCRVHICCGIASCSIPELYVGSLVDDGLLSILQRANQDLIVNWLALEGPASIVDFVRSQDPTIDLPTHYVNRCHACHTVFTHLRARHVLQSHASEHTTAVTLMRGVLDWISDDWARTAQQQPQGGMPCQFDT